MATRSLNVGGRIFRVGQRVVLTTNPSMPYPLSAQKRARGVVETVSTIDKQLGLRLSGRGDLLFVDPKTTPVSIVGNGTPTEPQGTTSGLGLDC